MNSEASSRHTENEAPDLFFLGRKQDDVPVELPLQAFKRHFVAIGGSGSGKTVLCKCVIEEAVRHNVPVIIVDPQGDISSLAMRGDAEEMAKHGTPLGIQQEFFSKSRIAIFTPASTKAIPISVNPFRSPQPEMPREEAVQAVDITASSLISFLGYDLDTTAGKVAKAYLFTILEYFWLQQQRIASLDQMVQAVLNPPAELASTLSSLIGRKEPEDIARKLRFLTVGTSSLMFQMGVQIDIDLFLDRSDGKVPVNIIYLNTLTSDNDKQFFLATLLKELYCWMLKNPSNELSVLFYVDEIAPYIPPYPRNPPPKEAYRLLFKQARKYGVGLVAATQNVTDIDYKALAQVNTWCLGRMMTTQDISRVQKIVQSIDPAHAEAILQKLPSLRTGEFLMLSPDYYDGIVDFQLRWLATRHLTLDERDLSRNVPIESRVFFENYIQKEITEKWAKAAHFVPPTNLEEKVQLFLHSERKVVSAAAIAENLRITLAEAEKALRKLMNMRIVSRGRAQRNRESLYWLAEFNLNPSKNIFGEVLTIPVHVTQIEATKRANRLLEGGRFRKEEEIYEAELWYLPIWKVMGTIDAKRMLMLRKEETRSFYVSAQTLAAMSFPKNEIAFNSLIKKKNGRQMDLDKDFKIKLIPKMPTELGKFPQIVYDEKRTCDSLELRTGMHPTSAEMILLPVWGLKVRHKKKRSRRIINMDAATGRLLSGQFKKP